MSLPTVWRRVKQDPHFPQPIKLSSGMTGFVEAEGDAYIEFKVIETRATLSKRATAATAAAASVKKRALKRDMTADRQATSPGSSE